MKNEPSAIEALDKLKGLCALKEFNVNDVHDCYSIIRAALNHEDVDLESIRSHETDYHKFPINKGWNDCLEYLKRHHKGEVIK